MLIVQDRIFRGAGGRRHGRDFGLGAGAVRIFGEADHERNHRTSVCASDRGGGHCADASDNNQRIGGRLFLQ